MEATQTSNQKRDPARVIEESLHASKRKRGWIEIIWLILTQCMKGSVKTRIMYRCNLNSKQMQQYLRFLLDCNFLEGRHDSDHVTTVYHTTELGASFVRQYQQLQDVLEEAISHRGSELIDSLPE